MGIRGVFHCSTLLRLTLYIVSQRDLRRGPRGVMVCLEFTVWPPWAVAVKVGKKGTALKSTIGLYARAVPGMHRAGPGERRGGSYGRRAVATAEWAARHAIISVRRGGKGLALRETLTDRPILVSWFSGGRTLAQKLGCTFAGDALNHVKFAQQISGGERNGQWIATSTARAQHRWIEKT